MSQPHTTLTPSNLQHWHLNSNSRGDYVTTQCITQHPTYKVGLGYTVTENFGDGIVLIGPTTWVTQDVLTFPHVANDLATANSYAPIPGIFFQSSKNKSIEASMEGNRPVSQLSCPTLPLIRGIPKMQSPPGQSPCLMVRLQWRWSTKP